MQLEKIREKAEALGQDHVQLKKKELIHAIQIAEGNFPCFLTATDFCDQVDCCWRDDCLSPRWLEGTRLEEIKAELEHLMGTIKDLKTTTNKLIKDKKKDASKGFKNIKKQADKSIIITMQPVRKTSKKAWKSTQKGIEDSWEEITKALKELTSRF